MHDWILVSVAMDWSEGSGTINFANNKNEKHFIRLEGLAELKMPRREEWGPSKYVNEVETPVKLDNGNFYCSIEIQSGDKIEIEAASIVLPSRDKLVYEASPADLPIDA